MRRIALYITMCILFPLYLTAQENEKPNVLMIAVDDLNDWVGVLGGHPQVKTPNIDKLANQGILFTNAHCQAPICGPSRASLLTGMYPTTTGNYVQLEDTVIKKANTVVQEAIYLPDYFEQNGYTSIGVGKIFHRGDDQHVFDVYGDKFDTYGPYPKKHFNYNPEWFGKPKGTVTDWGKFPEKDRETGDFQSAKWAVNQLQQKHDKPFFMAVGFVRPHVPWYVPAKWFTPFPINDIVLPPYKKDDLQDVPTLGRQIADVPMMPTTEELIQRGQWKEAVQAYLACIYFVDAQIGKVLNALEESVYADNTIVVLFSDHGYHLGEKNRFAKQALWTRDTRSVLAFKLPKNTGSKVTNEPVQLVDIYPTLLELAGLTENKKNDGHSLVPLMGNTYVKWNHVAITSYGKNNIAVTDKKYKFIQYEDGTQELYNLVDDPNEWNNIAELDTSEQIIKKLIKEIPKKQAPLSKYCDYKVNSYFKKLDKASK
ncbi:sulfatase [Flammeovirga kamogawensis]|uniref:Sulfatase n=1 Tax=Flammeovirga kamogawensis TaxID=373891 RepID=A0ABX8H4D0_9BACT|nr:sulfatase [Flammeovirga kamogawensis]MBB6461863.1 arylsulfatase A-like enzyme [Flammeovirga kamogawensis]QWG10523.1 sulfatase [Flammeovirga kamogawensis]TRX63632.1 sulfatase [Flammeovirga kamogawensis]